MHRETRDGSIVHKIVTHLWIGFEDKAFESITIFRNIAKDLQILWIMWNIENPVEKYSSFWKLPISLALTFKDDLH